MQLPGDPQRYPARRRFARARCGSAFARWAPAPPSAPARGRRVRHGAAASAVALAVALTGCSTGASADDATGSGVAESPTGAIRVVASTNVWGDIAAAVGGDHVDVTSLITDASQDPHEFEPSGRDELAVSHADVVVVNGGGYDDFLDRMVHALGTQPTVIAATAAAADVSSVHSDNEHLWFDLDAVRSVADAIADTYSTIDPAHATDFHSAASAFDDSLTPVRDAIAAVRTAHAGTSVAVTEPLPLYLIEAAGLDNVTPADFSEAIEEGIDVSPSELSEVLALFTEHRVKLLVYNDQSVSGQTEQVLAAAQRSDIAVLPVGETLPEGQHYQQWMGGIVGTLAADLDRRAEP
jgi:zinc/manganese transport system substrate-binding protein